MIEAQLPLVAACQQMKARINLDFTDGLSPGRGSELNQAAISDQHATHAKLELSAKLLSPGWYTNLTHGAVLAQMDDRAR